MIIQGGSSYLTKQNARSQRSSDSQSFEDILSSANTKKKQSGIEKSNLSNKKKEDKDQLLNSENNSLKQNDRNIKLDKKNNEIIEVVEKDQKQSNSSESIQAKESSDSNKTDQTLEEAKAEKLSLENLKTENQTKNSENPELLSLENSFSIENQSGKNLEVSEEGKNALLSLNLSAVDNKTLGKNEKIISDFENQMAQMMRDKNQVQSQESLSLNPQLGQVTSGQENQLKVEKTLKELMNDSTLTDGDRSLKGLSIEGSDSKASLLKDDKTDLESLFSQFTDQEAKVSQNEQNQFVDELNQLISETKSEKIENMQSIIKQAKASIDEGGGTMEIHLQPEGLGKVHLKVEVQNGQVNVEMLADNAAAKKALEDGLFEMKQSLENHKLLVNTIKVEMAPDYQKDFSDLANHMQEQANRDFAQQFLGQFRQERDERIGGLFDGFKNFQGQTKEPELVLSQRNPYLQNGKGHSLNVVA